MFHRLHIHNLEFIRSTFPSQDVNTAEKIVKMIDLSIKSTHLPTKISTLYASLHLLESGMSEITHQIVPILTDYLHKTLASITQ